jgi:hypothetical protein
MSAASISTLRPAAEEPAPRQAPAIGMSVVLNLGGDRQATLQCFVAQEDGEQAANDLLDRMFRIADRQRGRYEMADLEKERALNERQLAQFEENFNHVEKADALKRVELETEAEGHLAKAAEIVKDGYDAWSASGRRGEYVPQGHAKQQIDVSRKAAAGIGADLERMAAERKLNIENIEKTRDRYRAEIVRLSDEIANRKRLFDGA